MPLSVYIFLHLNTFFTISVPFLLQFLCTFPLCHFAILSSSLLLCKCLTPSFCYHPLLLPLSLSLCYLPPLSLWMCPWCVTSLCSLCVVLQPVLLPGSQTPYYATSTLVRLYLWQCMSTLWCHNHSHYTGVIRLRWGLVSHLCSDWLSSIITGAFQYIYVPTVLAILICHLVSRHLHECT